MWLFSKKPTSSYPEESTADYALDEKIYKADFEIASRCQGISKELLRISLAGLGVFAFLIKFASLESPSAISQAPWYQKASALGSLFSFAVCAALALYSSYTTSQCLDHQLIICRYFGRIESDRWDERMKHLFGEQIRHERGEQLRTTQLGQMALIGSTLSLMSGALCVAICCSIVLLQPHPSTQQTGASPSMGQKIGNATPGQDTGKTSHQDFK
jgi:hypothetical protein